MSGATGYILDIDVSADGKTAVSAKRWDSALQVWDLESGAKLFDSQTIDGHFTHSAVPRGHSLLVLESALEGGPLTLRDSANGKEIARFTGMEGPADGAPRRAIISTDRRYVAAAVQARTIQRKLGLPLRVLPGWYEAPVQNRAWRCRAVEHRRQGACYLLRRRPS